MRRNWIGLAVIALPCALYSMDLTVLDLALPRIAADLHPTANQLLWIIDIYGFVLASALITMGTLGDRIGRRRLLLVGAGAFGAVSVLASFATSVPMLIAMRALLGLAGATIAPSTLSLIHAMFKDERQRLFAIGVWTAAFSAGGLLGPLVGGVVLEHASWRAVFWIGVPAMGLLLATGRAFLPEVRAPQPGRFDVPSALLSIVAIVLAIYGIKAWAHGDVGAPFVLAGVGAGALFVRRQRRIAHPLVDLAMFRSPALSAALAAYVLAVFVVFGFYVVVAQHLQLVLGLSPVATGACLIPTSLGFLVGSLLTPRLSRSAPPVVLLAAGLALGAAGLVATVALGGLGGVLAGTFALSLGLSPVAPLASAAMLANADEAHAGAAAAISETGAELGGALGVALIGSLVAAVYRAQPGAIGDSIVDATTRALDPIALDGARAAFGHGFAIAAWVGAALLIATMVAVVRYVSSSGSSPRSLPCAAASP